MPDLLVVLIIVLIVALLWRGPKTIPKLGEALGRGVREARREVAKSDIPDETTSPAATAPKDETPP